MAKMAQRLRVAAGALALLSLIGCGGQAKVTGKVTMKGTPLNGGQLLLTVNNQPQTTVIQPDGSYTFEKIPVGTYKVGVITVPPKPPPGPAPKEMKMDASKMGGPAGAVPDPGVKLMPIPAKYNDPETSGLTLTVKSGQHKQDIPLD